MLRRALILEATFGSSQLLLILGPRVKRKLAIALFLVVLCWGSLCLSSRIAIRNDFRNRVRANYLPAEAYQAIESDPRLTLFSLVSDPPSADFIGDGYFHNHKILGQVVVSDPVVRRQMAGILREGAERWNLGVPSCFLPRHGLRAEVGGKTYDFLVAFECGELFYYPSDWEEAGQHWIYPVYPALCQDLLRLKNVPIQKFPGEE